MTTTTTVMLDSGRPAPLLFSSYTSHDSTFAAARGAGAGAAETQVPDLLALHTPTELSSVCYGGRGVSPAILCTRFLELSATSTSTSSSCAKRSAGPPVSSTAATATPESVSAVRLRRRGSSVAPPAQRPAHLTAYELRDPARWGKKSWGMTVRD